jgi:hypothetical protein
MKLKIIGQGPRGAVEPVKKVYWERKDYDLSSSEETKEKDVRAR